MVTKIEGIKENTFVCKEHYLAFKQSWKDYINAGKHKPVWIKSPYADMEIKKSNLTRTQHLLFNILTEKDLSKTFKPSSKEGKVGFNMALTGLRIMCYRAQFLESHDEPEERFERVKAELEIFLEPFGPAVTIKMLKELQVYIDNDISNVNDIREAA